MVGLGFYFIALFAAAFWYCVASSTSRARWLLRLMLWSLPLPWIAAELGWFVAEYGRQPWAIDGVLPTFLASSSVSAAQVLFTLAGFVLFYSALLVVDLDADAQIRARWDRSRRSAWRAAGRVGRFRRREGGIVMTHPRRLRNPSPDLVAVPRRAADRLRHHGRLRPRRRDAAAVRRPHRHRAARRHQHHRPGLGRQPGLADPRRRRDLRGLAADLRGVVLRLLHRHVPGAGDPDPAAGRLQVPQQDRRTRAGARSGTARCSPAASCRRWCSASRSATCCRACRSASTATCACSTRAAGCSSCSIRSACCAAWSRVAMLTTHGAVYLTRQGGRPGRGTGRAPMCGIGALVTVVLFVLAGVWVAFGIERLCDHRRRSPSTARPIRC